MLIFDGFVSTEETIRQGDLAGYIVDTIAIRVRLTKGQGKAQQCEGFISLPETKIPASASPGLHECVRYIDIGGEAFLTLFQLDRVPDTPRLILSFISTKNELAQVALPREPFEAKTQKMDLHSSNAKNPTVIEKSIKEIIEEARKFR